MRAIARRFGVSVILALTCVPGCSLLRPTRAELVSWRTTREPIPVIGGKMGLKNEGDVFVLVTVRATGTKLYRANDKDMYVLQSEDFTLSSPDGRTIKSTGSRNPKAEEFADSAYRDKPTGEEEVEVAFIADEPFAGRADLVLRYHDLPEVRLESGKKQPGGR